jgi:hypothetical protein
VAFAATQFLPEGLSVVTVIITLFPKSLFFGVYVNVNGDFVAVAGLTEPSPFSVIVTFVELPPNVLPVTVTGVKPHELPVMLVSVTVGGFTHCPNPLIEIRNIRLINIKNLDIFIHEYYYKYFCLIHL